MSEKQHATGALQSTDEAAEVITTLDNPMPAPPAKPDTTTLDNPMPAPPADPDITTLDNPMPAPPALGLGDK